MLMTFKVDLKVLAKRVEHLHPHMLLTTWLMLLTTYLRILVTYLRLLTNHLQMVFVP